MSVPDAGCILRRASVSESKPGGGGDAGSLSSHMEALRLLPRAGGLPGIPARPRAGVRLWPPQDRAEAYGQVGEVAPGPRNPLPCSAFHDCRKAITWTAQEGEVAGASLGSGRGNTGWSQQGPRLLAQPRTGSPASAFLSPHRSRSSSTTCSTPPFPSQNSSGTHCTSPPTCSPRQGGSREGVEPAPPTGGPTQT